MAKRITLVVGMFILVAAMLVPMMVTTSSAAARTDVLLVYPTRSTGENGVRNTTTNATKAFTQTLEFVYIGEESTDGYFNASQPSIVAGLNGGSSGQVTVFADFHNNQCWVYDGAYSANWRGASNTKTDYTFSTGKYYKFEYIVTTTTITLKINGQTATTFTPPKGGVNPKLTWNVSPRKCRLAFLSESITHNDGTTGGNTHSKYGSSCFSSYYCTDADYGEDTISNTVSGVSSYDLDKLRTAATYIESFTAPTYNRSTTETLSAKGFTANFGTDNGYSVFRLGTGTAFDVGSNLTFRVRIYDVDANNSKRWWGISTNTVTVGYDFINGRFGIGAHGSPQNSGSFSPTINSRSFALDSNRFYDIRFELQGDHTAVYVDDECLIYTEAIKKSAGEYLIFYPRCCKTDFAMVNWNFAGLESYYYDHPTGEYLLRSELRDSSNWQRTGGAYGTTLQTFTGKTIAKCDQSICVGQNYIYDCEIVGNSHNLLKTDIITNARNTWQNSVASYGNGVNAKIIDAVKAIDAIGNVSYDAASNTRISTAETKWGTVNTSYNAYVLDVWNASKMTAARNEYDLMDTFNTKVTAIGTPTASQDSKDKIAAADDAYGDVLVPSKVSTQKATLEQKRTAYNNACSAAGGAVNDAIDAIGTVDPADDSLIRAAETANTNCSFADARAYINNDKLTTLTNKRNDYDAIHPVYEKITAIGTVVYKDRTATMPFSGSGVTVQCNDTATNGEVGKGYTVFKHSGHGTEHDADSELTMRVRIRAHSDNATWGLSIGSGYTIGYDFENNRFGIMSNGMLATNTTFVCNVASSRSFNLDVNRFYDIKFEVSSTHLALYVDDECLIYTTAAKRTGADYLIHYPRHVTVDYAMINWKCGTTTYMNNVTGADLSSDTYWDLPASSASFYTGGQTFSSATIAKDSDSATLTTSISAAETAFAALTPTRRSMLGEYADTLEDAREDYDDLVDALNDNNTAIITAVTAIENLGDVTVDSGSALSAIPGLYTAVDSDYQSDVWNYSTYTAAQTDYNTFKPVYDSIIAINNITLESKSALESARSAYNGLTNAQKTKVDNGCTGHSFATLLQRETTYEGRKPALSMSASPDSSKVKANFYVDVFSTEDITKFTFQLNDGTPVALSSLDTADNAPAGKLRYLLPLTSPAKNMGDQIHYRVYYNRGGSNETMRDNYTSVAEYCAEIIARSDPQNENYAAIFATYAPLAQKMLNYGAAAQAHFGYDTLHPVSNTAPTATVTGSVFEKAPLVSALANADAPITYSAVNTTFLSDTSLYIAFKVKVKNSEAAASSALSWLRENVTFGGNAVTAANSYMQQGKKNGQLTENWYVFIYIQNIPIAEIETPKAITVANNSAGSLSVLNYIVMSQTSTSPTLPTLTKALYEYYLEVRPFVS